MTEERETDRPEDVGNDWDLENAVRHSGVNRSSVVVSVRLRGSDFDKISGRAESEGVPTSTFLRNAALEKVEGKREASEAYWIGGAAAVFTTNAAFSHKTSAEFHQYRYQIALARQE